MLRSHTGWQRLKSCVVGTTYPPEFYSWIKNTRLRSLFERIASETQEDMDNLQKTLESFDVHVIRPKTISNIIEFGFINPGLRIPGPISMTPRDEFCMIGEKFLIFGQDQRLLEEHTGGLISDYTLRSLPADKKKFYDRLSYHDKKKYLGAIGITKDPIDDSQISSLHNVNIFQPIIDCVQLNGNEILTAKDNPDLSLLYPNGIIRLGNTLLFGVDDDIATPVKLHRLKQIFPDHDIKFVNSKGHIDGCICPVKPGLLLSIRDLDEHEISFPGWEIVYLENQGLDAVKDWTYLKEKNAGKWWIPGHETDDALIDFVETWLQDWVGYVEETVFDVNNLVIDEKNILVSGYNKKAFDAFDRHGITPHVVPWRHRFFWDGGLHCITLDLDREA